MRIDGPQVTSSLSLNGTTITDLNMFVTTASFNGLTGSYATTGSNLFIGTQTLSGSILPSVNNTYDLGSPTQQFRHVYISSGSLYVNGTKVLGATSQELQITTDSGQSFKILESGSDTITLQSVDGNVTLTSSGQGDIVLDPTTGIIGLKGTVTVYTGNKITSSDGNLIQFGNGIAVTGSIVSTVTPLVSGSSQVLNGSGVWSGSAQLPSGVVSGSSQILNGSGIWSGSAQLPSGIISGSSQLPSGIVSSSLQVTGYGFATTGSNTFVGSQVITGSLYITNDMIVQGCSCLQNITASAVSIGTNVVMLNTATPAVRFAGISVQDSGSNAGVTGSIFWDGLCNKWIYSNPSTVGYSGGMLISGPRNTGTIGNESPLTCNYISKSGGGDHIYDSSIYESGGCVGIGTYSPQTALHISLNAKPVLRIDSSTTGITNNILITNSQTYNYGVIGVICGNGNATCDVFGLGYTTSMGNSQIPVLNWTSTGNVGINTTNTGNYKLYISNGTGTNKSVRIDIGTGIFSTDFGGLDIVRSNTNSVGDGASIQFSSLNSNLSEVEYAGYGFNIENCTDGSHKGSLTFMTAGRCERMRLTNIGNLGIGTTLPCALLHIADTTTPVIRLNRNTTLVDGNHIGYTEYYGNSTVYGYVGMWVESASTNAGQFRVLNGIGGTLTEKMRITSAGITCFACQICAKSLWFTSNTTAQLTFGSNDTCNPYVVSDSNNNLYVGSNNGYKILIPQDGSDMVFRTSPTYANPQTRLTITSAGIACFSCQICVSNNIVVTGPGIFINRPSSSSGEPYLFWQKDGVTRGSIYGANNADGLRYFGASHCFEGVVCTTQGVKFASGANALNYYEVGSWTPDVIRSSSNPTVSYAERYGSYVRVGNVVNLWFDITMSSISGGSGTYLIAGLPFTVSASMAGYSRVVWRDFTAAVPDANTVVSGFVQKGDTYIYPQNDFTGVCFGTKGSTQLQAGRMTGFVSYQA